MADIKISMLDNADPIRDGMIIPVSFNKGVDGAPLGKWKSGRISADKIADYVADGVLSKLKGINGQIKIEPEEGTGNWIISHDVDNKLFILTSIKPVDPDPNKIYIIPEEDESGIITYNQWYYDSDEENWIELGSQGTTIDLSGYYDKTEIDNKISNINTEITNNVSAISELNNVVNDSNTGLVKKVNDISSSINNLNATTAKLVDFNELKTQVNTNKISINNLHEILGSRVTNDDGKTISSTGIYKEIDDVISAYKAVDLDIYSKIDALETNKITLEELSNTINNHSESISNIEETLELKADSENLEELEERIQSLEEKDYTEGNLTAADVDKKLLDYVKTDSLNNYLTITSADTKYATLESVTDITKGGGIIDNKIDAAKNTLSESLEDANKLIEQLSAKISTLETKLEYYDLRFGWNAPDENGNINWAINFLQVENESSIVTEEN